MTSFNNKAYSKWSMLDQIYEAKKEYYIKGKSSITDKAYDALESGFVNIHGEDAKSQWIKVGYDQETHMDIKLNKEEENLKFRKEFGYA